MSASTKDRPLDLLKLNNNLLAHQFNIPFFIWIIAWGTLQRISSPSGCGTGA